MVPFIEVVYESRNPQVFLHGLKMNDDDDFKMFMTEKVASRLYDVEEQTEYESYLRGLSNTDFTRENMDDCLVPGTVMSKEWWDISEAIAEAFLTEEHNIIWPWNMSRDKRNPNASLAGADLVGFKVEESKVQFVFGEVKSSHDPENPPRVMVGMTNQIKNLAENSRLKYGLIRWLFSRCKTGAYENFFRSAMKLFMNSEGKDISLYGVLVRDTQPTEHDLKKSRGKLTEVINPPSICHLIALYLPCMVADLPYRVTGGKQ